jgi:hypothetical protein
MTRSTTLLCRRWYAVGLPLWVHAVYRQVGTVVEFEIFRTGRRAAKLESAVRATRFGVRSVWQCYGHMAVVRSGAVVVPPDPQCSGGPSPMANPLAANHCGAVWVDMKLRRQRSTRCALSPGASRSVYRSCRQ